MGLVGTEGVEGYVVAIPRFSPVGWRRKRLVLRRAVTNREVFEAAVDDRAEAFDWAYDLERRHPLEQMPVHDLDLNAGQVGAHAEVLAATSTCPRTCSGA
jgi:hypothetical protein